MTSSFIRGSKPGWRARRGRLHTRLLLKSRSGSTTGAMTVQMYSSTQTHCAAILTHRLATPLSASNSPLAARCQSHAVSSIARYALASVNMRWKSEGEKLSSSSPPPSSSCRISEATSKVKASLSEPLLSADQPAEKSTTRKPHIVIQASWVPAARSQTPWLLGSLLSAEKQRKAAYRKTAPAVKRPDSCMRLGITLTPVKASPSSSVKVMRKMLRLQDARGAKR
mmetsp:Transcript_17731/g.46146  ORF Transcript_17731/g.46146 Transcript_17731/m.46146 type:complete len:225 (+) Transcript_17731:279-953(+)